MPDAQGDRADRVDRVVEHFFRHESAHLVAVLTRAFGVRHLERIEDAVQGAMLAAVRAWKHRGPPERPAAWMHQTAKRRLLDALRREDAHARALAFSGQSEAASARLIDEWLEDEHLPDSLLRMIFVCCHPALERKSQIALTLSALSGFGVREIARGLLTSVEATKKRLQRAKATLAGRGVKVDLPPPGELGERLDAVHDVLYVMFNEGYSTSHGTEPIRDDICEEATRLCHLLAEHDAYSTPTTRALLALMVFHVARFEARTDADGATVLLEDQDRARWNRGFIRLADGWLARARTDRPSRFHYEAAIAQVHCHAPSVDDTAWPTIVALYDRLLERADSPLYVLNRAIALGEAGDPAGALRALEPIRRRRELIDYALLECARGRLLALDGRPADARAAYRTALAQRTAPHERAVIERRIAALG